jgi:rod shape determining protein RodA
VGRRNLLSNLDAPALFFYLALVFVGFMSVYSAVYNPDKARPIYDFSLQSGKQLVWIATSVFLIFLIFLLDYRTFESFAYIFHVVVLILLVLVLLIGREINGAKAWFGFGPFGIQPAEFAKITTALSLARFLGKPGSKITDFKIQIGAGIIMGMPLLLILLQPDLGSVLVFSSLLLMFYREGVNIIVLVIPLVLVFLFVLALIIKPVAYLAFGLFCLGFLILLGMFLFKRKVEKIQILWVVLPIFLLIGYVMSVQKIFESDKILKQYHKDRIMVLLDDNIDKKYKRSKMYNLDQSKIAIGSGGFLGKGFLEGTQTKLDFVPEQQTDFIFCTVGEEFGWLGSFILIALFVGLFSRIIIIAERQNDSFVRIYGYCVACILFAHFTFNISMTIGLFPVIGIPLPFISYGGSSLWAFTILLFILLKLDMHRNQLFSR